MVEQKIKRRSSPLKFKPKRFGECSRCRKIGRVYPLVDLDGDLHCYHCYKCGTRFNEEDVSYF
jgi:transcription elongation factor Elf1